MEQRSRISSLLVENVLRGQVGPNVLSEPGSQNSLTVCASSKRRVTPCASRFSPRPGQEASARPLREYSGNGALVMSSGISGYPKPRRCSAATAAARLLLILLKVPCKTEAYGRISDESR
ncbi:hypothetical protein VTN00DRAFT_1859 [Thermoascus crustaceus]|uniref:uncharacterized protein n=1 Tax=Thermoascus crustaceus TaxID=5088 RepID=UPI003742358D